MSLLSDIKSLQNQKDAATKHWWQQTQDNLSINGTANQAYLNEAKETLQEQNKQARARQVVAGGTDEGIALQQQANASAYADSVRNLAANLASQRNTAQSQYLAAQQQALQDRINRKQQQVDNISQAASGVVNAGLGLVGTALGGPIGGAVASQLGKTATDTFQQSMDHFVQNSQTPGFVKNPTIV